MLFAMVALAFVSADFFSNETETVDTPPAEQRAVEKEDSTSTNTEAPTRLRRFTAAEFKQLFDSLQLPNTIRPAEPPSITNDPEADAVILEQAEARGYRLQLVARSVDSIVDGVPLQERLRSDWYGLQSAAAEAGINLVIRSGYRSISEQRQLFLDTLATRGITTAMIRAGAATSALDQLLAVVAPPGYSRHHSGYTIDIADTSAGVFRYSAGYAWLSNNNFEQAKRYGFIPSYPELENQGPDPEPWEYVWANRDFVVE